MLLQHLRGLNKLWNLELTMDELAELGAEIGSDVSFCVYGGTALAKGRGEIITTSSATSDVLGSLSKTIYWCVDSRCISPFRLIWDSSP